MMAQPLIPVFEIQKQVDLSPPFWSTECSRTVWVMQKQPVLKNLFSVAVAALTLGSAPPLIWQPASPTDPLAWLFHSEELSSAGKGRGLIGGAESLNKLAEAGHAHDQTLRKRTTHPLVNSAGLAWPRLRRHDVTGRTRREGCRDGPKMAGSFGSASVYLVEPHSLPCC